MLDDIVKSKGEVRVIVRYDNRLGFIRFDEVGYALFRIWSGLGSGITPVRVEYEGVNGEQITLDEQYIQEYIDEADNLEV